jgi:hypothetical protein
MREPDPPHMIIGRIFVIVSLDWPPASGIASPSALPLQYRVRQGNGPMAQSIHALRGDRTGRRTAAPAAAAPAVTASATAKAAKALGSESAWRSRRSPAAPADG